MVKLTVKDGDLHVNGELLIVRYQEGDCDTIKFPFKSNEWRAHLASALFDEYEIGEIHARTVLLPDGTVFNIDENIRATNE